MIEKIESYQIENKRDIPPRFASYSNADIQQVKEAKEMEHANECMTKQKWKMYGRGCDEETVMDYLDSYECNLNNQKLTTISYDLGCTFAKANEYNKYHAVASRHASAVTQGDPNLIKEISDLYRERLESQYQKLRKTIHYQGQYDNHTIDILSVQEYINQIKSSSKRVKYQKAYE